MPGPDDTFTEDMLKFSGTPGEYKTKNPVLEGLKTEIQDSAESTVAGAGSHPVYAAIRGETDGVTPNSGIQEPRGVRGRILSLLGK